MFSSQIVSFEGFVRPKEGKVSNMSKKKKKDKSLIL